MNLQGTPPSLHWEEIGELLGREDLRVIRGQERERLLSLWMEISDQERALDDRLYLGIIGGTGVGKSTLINAIAGSSISRAGDRRPTTSRVVVYRHESSPLPDDFPREDLSEPEAVHREAGMERTLVLDFPDFDSVEADHASILARFTPLLDVILVVVDDEKYGDLRLFEVLSALPQAPRNLHFILNKVDQLARKYRERWPDVVKEILSDLRRKLAAHASLKAELQGMIPVSARVAFQLRAGGSGGEGQEKGGEEGDFGAVLGLLEGYRAKKLRRASKEANLDARKRALVERAEKIGLDSRKVAEAGSVREAMEERKSELEGILAAIPPEAIGPGELKRINSAAFRRAEPRLGAPLRLMGFFLWRKRESAACSPPELAALARAHYQPYRDALKAAGRELEDRVSRLAGPPGASRETGTTVTFVDRGRELLDELQKKLSRAFRLGRLRAHLLPAILIFLGLWFALHPVIRGVVQDLARGNPVDWSGALGQGLAALVAALSPLGLLFFLLLLLLTYAFSAYLDWRRIRRAVDGAVDLFEKALREDSSSEAEETFRRISAPLDQWDHEREVLRKALCLPPSR